MQAAKVVGRDTGGYGQPTGEYNRNPILDTRIYDIMFPDGTIQQYAENLIAENIYSQVNEEGYRYIILGEIIDYRKYDYALDRSDAYAVDKHGRRSRRLTTKGWSLFVNWKDRNQYYIPLKDIKESNPIEVEEVVKLKGI